MALFYYFYIFCIALRRFTQFRLTTTTFIASKDLKKFKNHTVTRPFPYPYPIQQQILPTSSEKNTGVIIPNLCKNDIWDSINKSESIKTHSSFFQQAFAVASPNFEISSMELEEILLERSFLKRKTLIANEMESDFSNSPERLAELYGEYAKLRADLLEQQKQLR